MSNELYQNSYPWSQNFFLPLSIVLLKFSNVYFISLDSTSSSSSVRFCFLSLSDFLSSLSVPLHPLASHWAPDNQHFEFYVCHFMAFPHLGHWLGRAVVSIRRRYATGFTMSPPSLYWCLPVVHSPLLTEQVLLQAYGLAGTQVIIWYIALVQF